MLKKEQIESHKLSYYIFTESQGEEEWLENICDQAIQAVELEKENERLKGIIQDIVSECEGVSKYERGRCKSFAEHLIMELKESKT